MIIIFFILGLIVGSFLNVVVYRLNVAETILGRSKCPHCKKQIRWYDNVPILSFVLLEGKCRDCEKHISWQYPVMEFLTGLIFAAIGITFFSFPEPASWLVTLNYLVIFSVFFIIAAYDLKYMEIPMLVLWIGVAWSFVYLLFSSWQNYNAQASLVSLEILSGFFAGSIAFLFLFSLSFFSKEKWMGMGDAYVALLAGLAIGWPAVLLGLFAAFAVGALAGIMLIIFKKKNLQTQIPFAPFIALGALLGLILPNYFTNIQDLFWFLSQ